MLGEKRVWLYPWEARPALHLRGDQGGAKREVGINNWERQSCAELHGARAQADAYVQLSTCQFLTSSLLRVEKAINGLDSSEICLRAQSDSLGKR